MVGRERRTTRPSFIRKKLVRGTASYYRKRKNIGWYIQLNLANAVDYDKPEYVDVGTYQGVTYRNTYQYLELRKLKFFHVVYVLIHA